MSNRTDKSTNLYVGHAVKCVATVTILQSVNLYACKVSYVSLIRFLISCCDDSLISFVALLHQSDS